MSERRALYTTAAPVAFMSGTTALACQPPVVNALEVNGDWLLAGGVKVARVVPGAIAFRDRDDRRNLLRGTDQIWVQASELIEVLRELG